MLKGTYAYGGYSYNISAYDFDENIAIYLNSPLTKGRLALDKGIHIGEDFYPPSWNDLYISIGIGNLTVSCYTEQQDGVTYKNELNKEALLKLGSILRGMKANCNKTTRDSNGELFTSDFVPNKVIKYIFDGKGYMELDTRTIVKMAYESEETSLFLEEDGSYQLKINKITPTQHKLKLDLSEFSPERIVEDDGWDFGDENHIFSLQDIIEKNPDKSYVWLNDRKYYVVKELSEVEAVCKKIWKHNGIVAFDTETTGLNVNITSRFGTGDRLVGMVFSITPGEAWYFPIAHKKVKNICKPNEEGYIIEKYFKPILEKKDLVCHNGAFDWKVMYNYDICLHIVHDTYILFKVTLWNDHRTMRLGLKELTRQLLGRDSFELSDFVQGKFGANSVKFWDLEEESVKYYACPDTDNLIELLDYALNAGLLQQYGAKKIYEIEVQFSLVIAYQEYYGHCVNVSQIDSLVDEIITTKETEYKAMVDMVGFDFNPNSPKDLQKIFFSVLDYPVVEYTDTGAPSCGKPARKFWMSQNNPDGSPKYPMAIHLHRWKEASTLESNFTKNIDKFATEDGLMFSEVQQFLETGRVSTKDPNYQSYSDTVKKYIVPREGYYALDADYSSVEARIMVSMAGCKNMVEKLKDPDADYHTLKASDMFGVPYELVSSKLRKMSKGVNFGILYGLGDPNLGVNLYGKKTPENTLKAKKQKELYFKGMEELREFIQKSKNQGTTQFYSTTFFGRRRYFDPRRVRKDTIERQACNARIQGTAADAYKIGMIRLFVKLRQNDLMGKVLISAFVHDECFLEVHKSLDPCKVLKMLRECMMHEIDNWCPLFIGAGFGRTWYEAKKTEIPIQVQESMINQWGDTGLDWWSGDTDRLVHWEIDEINSYRKNRVIDYLKDESNWNKVFNPVINSLAHEVLDEVKSGVIVEGAIDTNVHTDDDMLVNLKEFCRVFNCLDLYEKANIQKPEHKEQSVSLSNEEISLPSLEEASAEDIIKMRLNMIGVHSVRTEEGQKIYFKYIDTDQAFMKLIHNIIAKNPGDAKVLAVKEDGFYKTGMTMSTRAYPQLLQMYIRRSNMIKKG